MCLSNVTPFSLPVNALPSIAHTHAHRTRHAASAHLDRERNFVRALGGLLSGSRRTVPAESDRGELVKLLTDLNSIGDNMFSCLLPELVTAIEGSDKPRMIRAVDPLHKMLARLEKARPTFVC